MLTKLVNGMIDILVLVVNGLLSLLPESPFQFDPIEWGPFGSMIGTVFPVGSMATHMSLILGAFLSYYAIRWALRLIRQIQ